MNPVKQKIHELNEQGIRAADRSLDGDLITRQMDTDDALQQFALADALGHLLTLKANNMILLQQLETKEKQLAAMQMALPKKGN